jgi:hypothetical protein
MGRMNNKFLRQIINLKVTARHGVMVKGQKTRFISRLLLQKGF